MIRPLLLLLPATAAVRQQIAKQQCLQELQACQVITVPMGVQVDQALVVGFMVQQQQQQQQQQGLAASGTATALQRKLHFWEVLQQQQQQQQQQVVVPGVVHMGLLQ
jgi:hypothetical protein